MVVTWFRYGSTNTKLYTNNKLPDSAKIYTDKTTISSGVVGVGYWYCMGHTMNAVQCVIVR